MKPRCPIKSRRRKLIREKLAKRFGPYCHWCGCELQMDDPAAPAFATIDHLIARCLEGGSNRISNLRLACQPCNNGRHNSTNEQ